MDNEGAAGVLRRLELLTTEAFRDALAKGKGRAVPWALDSATHEIRSLLLEASLVSWQYDRWFEDARATYLIWMLEPLGLVDEAVRRASAAYPAAEGQDRGHQRDLLLALARQGHAEARGALERFAPMDAEVSRALAEWSPLYIAGYIQAHREDWEDLPTILFDSFSEVYGEEETSAAIDAAGPIALSFWQALTDRRATPPAVYEPRRTTFDDLHRSIQISNEGQRVPVALFGRHAPREELEQAAYWLMRETVPHRIEAYARIFSRVSFVGSTDALIDRALGPNGERYLHALERVSHPRIRVLMDTIPFGAQWLTLLKHNLRDGDPEYVRESLQRWSSPDADESHHLCLALLKVVEGLADPREWREPLLWGYETTPCGMCRGAFAKLLVGNDLATAEIREELLYDSEASTRALLLDAG